MVKEVTAMWVGGDITKGLIGHVKGLNFTPRVTRSHLRYLNRGMTRSLFHFKKVSGLNF